MTTIAMGAAFGAFVHALLTPDNVPVMGVVIGGLFFYALHQALRPE